MNTLKTKYETGATTHAVNDLVLFTDNTIELAEMRDYLFTCIINNEEKEEKIWEYFGGLRLQASKIYKNQLGRSNSLHIINMTYSEVQEYCNLFATEFKNWKKEHGYN